MNFEEKLLDSEAIPSTKVSCNVSTDNLDAETIVMDDSRCNSETTDNSIVIKPETFKKVENDQSQSFSEASLELDSEIQILLNKKIKSFTEAEVVEQKIDNDQIIKSGAFNNNENKVQSHSFLKSILMANPTPSTSKSSLKSNIIIRNTSKKKLYTIIEDRAILDLIIKMESFYNLSGLSIYKKISQELKKNNILRSAESIRERVRMHILPRVQNQKTNKFIYFHGLDDSILDKFPPCKYKEGRNNYMEYIQASKETISKEETEKSSISSDDEIDKLPEYNLFTDKQEPEIIIPDYLPEYSSNNIDLSEKEDENVTKLSRFYMDYYSYLQNYLDEEKNDDLNKLFINFNKSILLLGNYLETYIKSTDHFK